MAGEQKQEGWFYVDSNREKQGPFSVEEFKALADQKVILGDTLIWTQNQSSWIPARELAGLIAPPDSESPSLSLQNEASSSPSSKTSPPKETPKDSSESAIPDEELKPQKSPFLLPRAIIAFLASLTLAIIAAVVCLIAEVTPLIGGAVFILFLALFLFASLIAYRKERYHLTHSTILCHQGGLVSDQLTEVEIRNITHVAMTLPWIRHRFFGIGTISIDSAGTSKPVVLRCILNPEGVYERINKRMKQNGYQLGQKELLHEESPAILGILTDSLRLGFGTLVMLGFAWSSLAGFYQDMAELGLGWMAPLGLTLLSLAAIAYLVILFLDMRRRTYRVYDDVVVYEDGFLTRRKAFIPYENIADATTQRTFWDQLLNLYDVLVSCQGSATEIKFRRLRHGIHLSDTIDQLVIAANQKPSPAAQLTTKESDDTTQITTRKEPELIAPGEAWVADLKMSPARVFLPLLILIPLFPIWIILTIGAAIRMMATNYAVRPGSIRHSYRFLTTNDREFAYDKITGLVVKENLWDRMLGTFTLRFWSIGSGESLELAHISRSQVDLDAVLSQIGIPTTSENVHKVPAQFGVGTWLRAHCYLLAFSFLAIVAIIIVALQSGENLVLIGAGLVPFFWIIGFIYARIRSSKQDLSFHDHHIEAEQGILIKRHFFARYRNVKKSLATQYPGGKQGSLQVFVAGEQIVKAQLQGSAKSQQTLIPCSFTLRFLPEAFNQGRLLDDILSGRVSVGPNTSVAAPLPLITESRRGLGNSVFSLVLASIILLPLVLLLPLTLPLRILAVKKWRYRVEAGRIVNHWGLFFHKQASIVLDRVDSLEQRQGPLNKAFKNGNVSIMTAGSSNPDLVMLAAKDHQSLYQEVRKLSQKNSNQ